MDIRKNTFKQMMESRTPAYGLWNGIPHAYVAEIIAGAGFDWVCIDGEHGPIDFGLTLFNLQAIQAHSVSAIVRIPELNVAYIKQLLDAGALNILVPMIETVEQAELFVQAMHYPPNGIRGVGTALARAAQWNRVDNYFEHAGNEVCPIAQIESIKGVEALDDILKIEGLDVLFIGPADLAATMGYLGKPSEKEVVDLVKTCIQKINAAGKVAGFLTGSTELALEYKKAGALMIGVGIDTLLLSKATTQLARQFKSNLTSGESSTVY